MKVFADDKTNGTHKMNVVLGWVENIDWKGENAASIFSFSHKVFECPIPEGH